MLSTSTILVIMVASVGTIMAVVLIYKLLILLFIPATVHPMPMPSAEIVVDTNRDNIQLEPIQSTECVICFEDLNPAYGTIADLSCHHNFHKACIFHWFNSTTDYTCPYCRQIPTLPIKLKRYDPTTDVMTTSKYPE